MHRLLFALPKLESAAQAIITPRRAHIEAFARQCVREHDAACDANTFDSDVFWQTFREIESTLAIAAYLPLAHQLEMSDNTSFVQHAQGNYLERLRRTNVLHIPGHNPRKKAPPPDDPAVAEIYQQIRAVLTSSDDVTKWVAAFKQQCLFRSDKTAEHVAYDFAKVPQRAASTARHLVQTWLQIGDSALLYHSDYPYVTELALVQAQVEEAARQSDRTIDSPAVLRELRADVVCMVQVLQMPDWPIQI